MADDERSEIRQSNLNKFKEGGYARAINELSYRATKGEIYLIDKKVRTSKVPPSLKLNDNPFLMDPRDFEPATEEEYQKQELMKELG